MVKIPTVVTILAMERGALADLPLSVLVPIRPGEGEAKGLWHVLEHLICYRYKPSVRGVTKEDYIALILSSISAQQLLRELADWKVERWEAERAITSVLGEIIENRYRKDSFWEQVWKDTPYEDSPLGLFDEVRNIAVSDIKRSLARICRAPMYFYEKGVGLFSSRSGRLHGNRFTDEPSEIEGTRSFEWGSMRITGYYFSNAGEEVYLASEVIKLCCPGNRLQVCEKKGITVLLSNDLRGFPRKRELGILVPKASSLIRRRAKRLGAEFWNHAINELESYYYHQMTWEQRLERLSNLPERRISRIIDDMEAFQTGPSPE